MSRAVYTEQWYCVPAVDNPAICTRIQWSSKESSSPTAGTLSTQSLHSAQLSPTAESQMCQFAYFVITTSTFWQAGSSYFGNLYMPLGCSVILHAALSQSNEASRNTEVNHKLTFMIVKLGMEMGIDAIYLVLEYFSYER